MDDINIIKCEFGLICHKISDRGSIIEILKADGRYQPFVYNKVRELARENSIIVDAGANIGTITVPIAQSCNGNVTVLAFEPVKQTFNNLCVNIELNNLSNVKAYNIALGRSNSKANINILPNDTGEASFYENFDKYGGHSEEVEIRTLDSYSLENVSVIKSDVQYAEYDLLVGARDTIVNNQCAVIVEAVDRNKKEIEEKERIIGFFRDINYVGKNISAKDVLFLPKVSKNES